MRIQRFVGRASEIGNLNNCLETARHGSSRLIILSGEAGVGKTTLLEQWLGQQPRETLILRAEAEPEHDGPESPLAAIVAALETALGHDAGGEFEAMLREHAPEWHTAATHRIEPAAAAPLDPTRLVELLTDLARRRTVVVALDNLHRASVGTVEMARRLARARSRPGLLVIATLRATEAVGLAADMLLSARTGDAGARELSLHRFDLATTGAYVRALLPEASDGLCAQIHERSDGHPFLLAALVGDLRARGDNGTTGMASSLRPSSLRAWVAEQLKQLASTDRTLLESAAVIGLEFDAALLAAILGRRRAAVAARLFKLSETLPFLVATSPSRWCLQHPLVREALRHFTGPRRSGWWPRATSATWPWRFR